MNKQERDELRFKVKEWCEDLPVGDLAIDVQRICEAQEYFEDLLKQLDAYESVVEAAREWATTTEMACWKLANKENDLDKRELLKSALQSSRQTIKALEGLEDED